MLSFRFPPTFPAIAFLALLGMAAQAGNPDRTPLNGQELTELLSGNTETWATAGAGYYHPEGRIDFVWNKKPGSGDWKVMEDGTLCLKITAWYGNDFKCNWTYFRQDGEIFSQNLETGKATKMPGFAEGKTF